MIESLDSLLFYGVISLNFGAIQELFCFVAKKKVFAVVGAALAWGIYGVILHAGRKKEKQ